jgi:hypothetical protein
VPPELAQAATAEPAAEFGSPHWTLVRRIALGAYFVVLGAWSAAYGIPTQRELVVAWICGALVLASLGRPPRVVLQVFVDWLPIVVLLFAYDFTRGAADSLGIGVHSQTMIDFDRFLFLGTTPTEWLQANVNDPYAVNGWDVAFTLTYTSYFIAPFALAGVLWIRDHPAFVSFMKRLVTLVLAGLATYILFPATPPWCGEPRRGSRSAPPATAVPRGRGCRWRDRRARASRAAS